MTELLSRPPGPRAPRRPPAGPPARPVRPVTVVGVVAALQAAGLGVLAVMVLVLVGWATTADAGGSAGTAVAGALQVWLVGHLAVLAIPGGTFSLVPLGLTALPLALLHTATLRAGRAAGVSGRRGVIALTSAVTATYAVAATVVAVLARTDVVQPQPRSAFLGAAALAGLAAGSAAVRATRRGLVLWHRLPPSARLALPPAAGALGVLVAGGALLGALLLATHHGRAGLLLDGLDPGAGGTLFLLLGSVLYVPTAAVWGLAYAVGPGFAVGAGTSVSVAGADLGAVPAFPLLAALPEGTGAGAGLIALTAPVVAGLVGAVLLHRAAGRPGAPDLSSWRAVLAAAGATGAAVAVATGLLAAVSAGSAGPGRMADTGPTWWAVGPLAGLEVAAVVAVALLARRRRGA
jgi:hypothetical protein